MRAAVARLAIPYPVVVDSELEIWRRVREPRLAGPLPVQPARPAVRLPLRRGGYDETERAIQELLGEERAAVRAGPARGRPRRALAPQSDDVDGPYSGPYEAGAVWAVLDGSGTVTANGRTFAVDPSGLLRARSRILAARPASFELVIGEGVRCHAVCFTPGLAT